MENVKYLSIAEFAEAAKVSKQAIYKQVNNENSQLAPYILRDGKKTLISIAALPALYKVEIENTTFSTATEGKETTLTTQDSENSTQQTTQEVEEAKEETTQDQPFSSLDNQPISTDYIAFLKAEIEELKSEKAQTEQRLNDTIKEKDQIIKQQTEQLASLAQQVADIATKALITTSQQQYLTAAEKVDKQEPPAEEAIIKEVEPEAPKKGFLAKLFGK